MNRPSDEPRHESHAHATEEEVSEHSRLKSTVIYEVIEHEGEEELRRPLGALWWSGLAAGLSIGFSVLAEAYLHTFLPDASWRPAIENLGYSVGFLIVILGRQQLFTENTITAVVPVLSTPNRWHFLALIRLWSVVFVANIVGTVLFATFVAYGGAIDEEALDAARQLGVEILEAEWTSLFVRAILAGWLIAALVWIIPNSEGSKAFVIILLTYLIALNDLAHVIAGSVEVAIPLVEGTASLREAIFGFLVPVLLGNVVGGTVLFTLLTYGQVREELEEEEEIESEAVTAEREAKQRRRRSGG